MPKSKYKLHKINRRIHLYSGLFMTPFIFIFGLSGLSFNHITFLSSNRSLDYFNIAESKDFNNLFPNLEELANRIKDSLQSQRSMDNLTLESVGYNNTMILRNRTTEVDYRIQVDIPTGNVQVMTLPDFAESPTITRGQLETDYNLDQSKLLSEVEKILREKGFNLGTSRVQRIPNLQIDLKNADTSYRVLYNMSTGSYRVDDLDKRTFKFNYLVGNLHELHGYPLSGFSLKWLWVFFADALALLMMIWAITGLIMWFKMKRQFVIGLLIVTISFFLFIAIMINQYELGY